MNGKDLKRDNYTRKRGTERPYLLASLTKDITIRLNTKVLPSALALDLKIKFL